MRKEHLEVLSGPFKGKKIPIEGSVSIGRNPDNTLQLEDLQISRKHAVVEQDAKGTILRDLGSGNGTYVDSRRVLEYKLSDGDVFRLGQQEVRYVLEEDGPVTPKKKPDSGVRFQDKEEGQVQSADAANVYETFFQAPQSSITQEQLRETQERLQAVYSATEIITSEHDLNKVFAKMMDQIFDLIPAHNGVILLKHGHSTELVTEFVKSGDPNHEVAISSTIVNRAFGKGEAVITYDAADDSRFEAGASIISQNISSAMCVPLTHQGERLGVLYVDTHGTTNAFVSGDLELLVALAGSSAIAIKNAQYLRDLEQSYQDNLLTLANAIEMRDHYTVGHTWRVTNFSIEIAREMGWSEEKLEEVRMGGVLHDVGKIAVSDSILGKSSRLTDEEFEQMKVHPERGARLLGDVELLHPLIPYCLYHHERYDGKGYPYGLKGEDIPIEGRLVAVADTFDAMTSNRPYRKGLDPKIAIDELEKNKGTQFDPDCVDAMLRAYRAGKIDRILQDFHKQDGKSVACPFCSTYIKIPEGAAVNDVFDCEVCHRRIKLVMENDYYYGELVSQVSGASAPIPTAHPGSSAS